MGRRSGLFRTSAVVVTAALAGAPLAACDKGASPGGSAAAAPLALPLTTAAANAPASAPVADALPPAARPPVVRVLHPADRYAYLDQAYAMSRALGQAPPDYAFDYQGVRPWAWRTSSRALRLVEPTPDGERYYYYQPGADYPYLVRDPRAVYGFSDG